MGVVNTHTLLINVLHIVEGKRGRSKISKIDNTLRHYYARATSHDDVYTLSV